MFLKVLLNITLSETLIFLHLDLVIILFLVLIYSLFTSYFCRQSYSFEFLCLWYILLKYYFIITYFICFFRIEII